MKFAWNFQPIASTSIYSLASDHCFTRVCRSFKKHQHSSSKKKTAAKKVSSVSLSELYSLYPLQKLLFYLYFIPILLLYHTYFSPILILVLSSLIRKIDQGFKSWPCFGQKYSNKPYPVKDDSLHLKTLFRTRNKIHTLRLYKNLNCLAMPFTSEKSCSMRLKCREKYRWTV